MTLEGLAITLGLVALLTWPLIAYGIMLAWAELRGWWTP